MNEAQIWLRRWGPALLMMVLIFIASSIPGNDLPDFGEWSFTLLKSGHTAGYALLAASFLHALGSRRKITSRLLIMAIILAGLYAITDEFHQSFTPGRSPSARDVGIDTFGATLGAGLWTLIRTLARSSRSLLSPP